MNTQNLDIYIQYIYCGVKKANDVIKIIWNRQYIIFQSTLRHSLAVFVLRKFNLSLQTILECQKRKTSNSFLFLFGIMALGNFPVMNYSQILVKSEAE